MRYQELTFFQVFNAMRQYLTSYLDIQENGDISILLRGLTLDTSRENWRNDLRTWDQAMLDDWILGVRQTLRELKIEDDPRDIKYNEQMALLCMKNYLQIFYNEIPFQDIGILLQRIQLIKQEDNNREWNHWLDCIEYVVANENQIRG